MSRPAPRAAALAILVSVLLAGLSAPAFAQCGSASWYSLPRNKTANGERMNPAAMTAAHRSLPFGTKLRVTNQRNGKSVIVRINDRGPFIKGRVLDLSKGAAAALGFVSRGHTKVCMDKH
jgi:rare lipoprotein A